MTLRVGDTIGPYRIVALIGQGGMAMVYKAHHAQLDRFVALKLMHQILLDDSNFLIRFQREAQIIARLEHPHIVPVYDFNQHNGQPYLVMKYLEGHTLKQAMADPEREFEVLVDHLTKIADALHYAHQRGVIHRDVKPSNIIIDAGQQPFVTDFGLARLAQTGTSTLSQDMLIGTPSYMSPEQARGDIELDAGTDIYALGVILYELCVGRVPFADKPPTAIVHDHIYTPLPLPSQLNPAVSPDIEQVLLKALAKERADRYTTAPELVSAFKQAAQRTGLVSPGQARPQPIVRAKTISVATSAPSVSATQPVSVPRPQRRPVNRNVIWLAALAAVLLIILGAILRLVGQRLNTETPLPTLASTLSLTTPEQQPTEALTPASNDLQNSEAYLLQARDHLGAGDLETARQVLIQGQAVSQNPAQYWIAASDMARESGYPTLAILLRDQAYIYSLNTSTADAQAIRAAIGEYYYRLAEEASQQIDLDAIRQFYRTGDMGDPSNLLQILQVQVLLKLDRPRLADAAFNRLSPADRSLPEARLIFGELEHARGRSDRALEIWRTTAAMPDAPQWVAQRAAALIQSTSGA